MQSINNFVSDVVQFVENVGRPYHVNGSFGQLGSKAVTILRDNAPQIAVVVAAFASVLFGSIALYQYYKPKESKPEQKTENESNCEMPLLPEDVWNGVFSHSKSDLVALSCVSQSLNKCVRVYAEKITPEGCFGMKEWNNYGANLEKAPSIPLKMVQDFDPRDWMLTFIPEMINGEPLTLSSIDRFVSDFKNGKEAFKSNYQYPLKNYGIDDTTPKPFKAHWIMLSKDVLGGKDLENGTRNKKFEVQEGLVKKAGYEIPDLIDTVVSIFMHQLATDVFIYPAAGLNGNLWTYTRVQEQNKSGYRIIVGGFSALGLDVHHSNDYGYAAFGASRARKSIGH